MAHASLCWGGGSGPNGLGRDLRPDEALSLTFTGEVLRESLDIWGFPEVLLYLQCSAPVAHVIVRLTDVAPDGTSAQVSAGVLNLTHRHSHAEPQPIDPTEWMAIRLKMRATCYRFAPGHRIRLTIASAYWPVIWPSPYPGENRLQCSTEMQSHLILPLLDDKSICAPTLFKTSAPELIPVGNYQSVEPVWQMMEDVIAGTKHVHIYDGEEQTLPNGDSIFTAERLQMRASVQNPANVRFASEVVYHFQTEGQQIAVQADATIQSSETAFQTEIKLRVTLDEHLFFERNWQESVERWLC